MKSSSPNCPAMFETLLACPTPSYSVPHYTVLDITIVNYKHGQVLFGLPTEAVPSTTNLITFRPCHLSMHVLITIPIASTNLLLSSSVQDRLSLRGRLHYPPDHAHLRSLHPLQFLASSNKCYANVTLHLQRWHFELQKLCQMPTP